MPDHHIGSTAGVLDSQVGEDTLRLPGSMDSLNDESHIISSICLEQN